MFVYDIGSDVHFTDGETGKLAKVVIDPHTKRVTDLVVKVGLLFKKERVIPVELVEEVEDDEIQLIIFSQELNNYPEYSESEFADSDPEILDELGYSPDQGVQWALRYGRVLADKVWGQPRIGERVEEDAAAGKVAIGRGTRVHNDDETIGYIDHLLVDEHGQITNLIVRRGLLPFRAVIPMSMVEEVDRDSVLVPASRKELQSLAKFTPRADRDILRQVEDELQAAGDVDLRHIKVSLADGIVRLTGPVLNVLGKRQAHQIAAGIEGVLGVENRIITDEELEARVAAALLTDERTFLATVEVKSENGVVTLEGEVDSEETLDDVLEIAASQPGVLKVNNQLTTK